MLQGSDRHRAILTSTKDLRLGKRRLLADLTSALLILLTVGFLCLVMQLDIGLHTSPVAVD